MNDRSVGQGVSYPTALAGWSPSTSTTRAWSIREPALGDLDLPALTAILLDPATSHRRRDDLLGALVRLAPDDADAATAVVVCLLPGLRRMVRRLDAGTVELGELWSELLVQTIVHVRGYDLARRPRRIAANLLLDTMSHTLTYLRRESAWQIRTEPLHAAELLPAAEPDGGDLLREPNLL